MSTNCLPVVSRNRKTWRTEAMRSLKPADRTNNSLGNFGHAVDNVLRCAVHAYPEHSLTATVRQETSAGLATVQTSGMQSIASPAQRLKTTFLSHSTFSRLATFITDSWTALANGHPISKTRLPLGHLYRTRQPRNGENPHGLVTP